MNIIDEINVDQMMGRVANLISDAEKRRGVLIQSLHRIQEHEGYLPAEVLEDLAGKLNISLSEIYSVASFYAQYHFSPRGKKIVRVCMGTACHVRGASLIVEGLEHAFKIKQGETTEDLKLTLETVGCVGCCGLAPVATVNDAVKGEIGPEELKTLINEINEG